MGDFIRDTASILDMLRKEVPLQVEMSAVLVASIPTEEERISNLEKTIEHFKKKIQMNANDTHSQATLERLTKEVEYTKDRTISNKVISLSSLFTPDKLRERLHVIFGAYLAFLQEKDIEGFNKAIEIIEQGIKDRKKILADVKKILGLKGSVSKLQSSISSGKEKALAVRAEKLIAPVDKVSKSLFDRRKNSAFYENPEVLTKVGTKGSKPVTSIVSININELKNITLSNDVMLNPYNRAIHNIAVSLYTAGNTHITPRMIYHTMNGGSRDRSVPEQVYKDIMNSMRKLMLTFIKIDASEEAKAFGFDKLKFEGYLLPVKLVTAQINGQEIECFKFLDEPPLYTYASKKKQISRCDIGLLAADVSMTPENIVIRDYLLEQILTMQNENSNRNNVILYDTLYDYLDVEAPTEATAETKRRRVRSKVKAILEAWVKAKFIAGYDEIIEGRKISGLYVKLHKERK